MKSERIFLISKQIAGVILVISFCILCTNQNNKLSIGKNGTIKSIIIPNNAVDVTQFAASELQEYMEEITGIRLAVVESNSTDKKTKAIVLSRVEDKDLVWDGFKINTGSENIVINANDPRGLLYGVYQLLEDVGCAFVYLGEEEEIVPKRSTVEFRVGEQLFNPAIEHRGLTPYGLQGSSLELSRNCIDWMAKNKLNFILVAEDRKSDCPVSAHSSIWKEVHAELLPELQKRGFVIEMGEHTIDIFFPRTLFNEHPEWFALIEGKRRIGDENDPYTGQMCYSNRDAVEYYANAVADYAAKHPEFDIIGTWPRDGGQWCECENCQKDPSVFYRAIKHVAQKVEKINSDIAIEYMIYPKPKGFQPPPKILPDNMSFLWIPDNGVLDDLAKQWSTQSNRQAQGTYQFEYLMGDNYRSRANVWLSPEVAISNAKHAREMEFRGVNSLFLPIENWWRSCFNNWFFAKACWDIKLDVDSCLHNYCSKYYGNSAKESEDIFRRILNELQSDESIMIYTDGENNKQKYESIKRISDNLLEQIDTAITNSSEPDVAELLKRVKAYVEYFGLHYKALITKKKEDLARLVEYSQTHTNQDMVIMDAEYIRWRNSELFDSK